MLHAIENKMHQKISKQVSVDNRGKIP